MGKKRKIISQRNLWKKYANHPAVKARQSKSDLAEETVAAQPKPEPKKAEVKDGVKKVEVKPDPKPAVKKVAVKSSAKAATK